jgi:hypothetical protein
VDLGNRLQRWWDRVRGYEPPAAKPVDPSARKKALSSATRPIRAVAEAEPGESLKLSVEGKRTQGSRKRGYGEAGFDPYSNTGGYGKPRGWDDVPRK